MVFYLEDNHVSYGYIADEIVDYINQMRFEEVWIENLDIRTIPNFDSVKTLTILECDDLVSIETMENLETLVANNNGRLRYIPNFPNLKYLDCSHSSVNTLPSDTDLTTLICSYTNVTLVPDYPNLIHFNCVGCRDITRIPYLPMLQEIETVGSSIEDTGIISIQVYDMWKAQVERQLEAIQNRPRYF